MASSSDGVGTVLMSNPRVGVAAVIVDNGKMVFGRRKGSHGAGKWQFPGGHLKYGETLLGCAARETLEETGLVVKALHVSAITNDVFPEVGKHYVTIFVLCRRMDASQEPELREPDKCEGWSWASWAEIRALPSDTLFMPIMHLLEQYDDVERLFA